MYEESLKLPEAAVCNDDECDFLRNALTLQE